MYINDTYDECFSVLLRHSIRLCDKSPWHLGFLSCQLSFFAILDSGYGKKHYLCTLMEATIEKRIFHFRFKAGTSRGSYTTRTSWLVTLTDEQGHEGRGECAPLPQLSCDDVHDYEAVLQKACRSLQSMGEVAVEPLRPYPSILFGLETAMLNLKRQSWALFDTPFSQGKVGIPINGLVWMGSFEEMKRSMEEKLSGGYRCVKLKIGAIDFDEELSLIRQLRQRYSKEYVELRVDANGAFSPEEAPHRLEQLARYDIHSIEQPIRQRQWQNMARLCRNTPLPIALDEELIGVNMPTEKEELLDTIRPQYIILKPSLHGGMTGCAEWVDMADKRGVGSWMTSALECNIGLNAVAHLAAHLYGPDVAMPQGLGTGQLFTDNVFAPLRLVGDKMWFGRDDDVD